MSQIVFHFERASKDYQFTASYAEFSRSICVKCEKNITKDALQLGVLEQSLTHDERRPKWYHLDCFFKMHHLQYAESIDGFCKLRTKHKNQIRQFLMDESDCVSHRVETHMEKLIEKQNTEYFKLRDQLSANVSPEILKSILKVNKQAIPDDLSELLDHCADVIYFGSMMPCEKCKNGKFRSGNFEYVCDGYINPWVECDNVVINPERNNIIIPPKIKNAHSFLAKQFTRRTRYYKPAALAPKAFWACPQADLSRYLKKMKPNDIAVVDPESGLEEEAHIYCDADWKYSAILSLVDITYNKKSYYQIQLLESNDRKCYWVFEYWGRISTIIGSTALRKFSFLRSAKKFFETNYFFMTNNNFHDENFVKFPGKYFKMDIDTGSKLEKPVQELIDLFSNRLIQGIPGTYATVLGKISPKQINAAIVVLNKISNFIAMGGASHQHFVGASNHFHMLVPKDHGVINDILAVDYCMKKLEIAQANMPIHKHINPDTFYEKLNCDIHPIDKNSEEFKLLLRCFNNSNIKKYHVMKIKEIFTVNRQGEESRFEPFQNLNRRLLWHGSDIQNFNGILKNGLKVQPKEAQRCDKGWFGKGIYFADMVSNSIDFCSRYGPMGETGLMLLCEVALGDSLNLGHVAYVAELPAGKNSVKGFGNIYLSSSGIHRFSDGSFINTGTKVAQRSQYPMNFNEYVVFDPAQVKLRYLFQFKYSQKK